MREDLAFIREQTNAEIANVERLFNRAVTTITWILTAAAVVIAFLGWGTYSSLRDLVVTTTKTEMDRVVKQQIAEQLQHENVEKIVSGVVTSKAEEELRNIISQQVSAEVSHVVRGLQPQINQVATKEAKRIVAERLAPRRLTSSQREEIVAFLSTRRIKTSVRITPMENSPEEHLFAEDIGAAVKAAHWGLVLGVANGYGGPESFEIPPSTSGGIFLVAKDPTNLAQGSDDIVEAFRKAGLVITITKSSMYPWGDGPELVNLMIGPK